MWEDKLKILVRRKENSCKKKRKQNACSGQIGEKESSTCQVLTNDQEVWESWRVHLFASQVQEKEHTVKNHDS